MSCNRSCHNCRYNMPDGCCMPYSDKVMGTIYDEYHNVIGCNMDTTIETVNYGKTRKKQNR